MKYFLSKAYEGGSRVITNGSGGKFLADDGTYKTIDVSGSGLTAEQVEVINHVLLDYNNGKIMSDENFTITFKNKLDSLNGERALEMKVNTTHLQWRYVGDAVWNNLISLDELRGFTVNIGETGQVLTKKSNTSGDWEFRQLTNADVGLGNIQNVDTTNIDNINESATKKIMTDIERTKLSNAFTKDTDTTDSLTEGSTKLLLTTTEREKLNNISGVNTGDQDLSGLVQKTTTINGYSLSSNIEIPLIDTITSEGTGTSILREKTVNTQNIKGISGNESINIIDDTVNKNIKIEVDESGLLFDDIPDGTLYKKLSYGKFDEITHTNRTALDSVSGTNTGDETKASIEAKLTGNIASHTHSYEPTITAGTTAQYYRGDKTFQTLDKTAVGLSNVTNDAQIKKIASSTTDNIVTFGTTTGDTVKDSGKSINNIAFKNEKNTFTEDVTIGGTLQVNGNIVQNGSTYETHSEQVYTKDNTIILRDGAVSGLGAGEFVGFTAKLYDGTNDGQLVFDKDGTARVGDIGNTQPIATREETPSHGNVAIWDSVSSKFITSTGNTGIGSIVRANSPIFTGTVRGITSAMVGLAKVNNTADSEKEVLSATKLKTARNLTIGSTGKTFDGTTDVTWTLAEIGAAEKEHTHNYEPANVNIQSHISNNSNPHSVTKTQVGLGNVANIDTSNPANIAWNASYRTVTDTEKTTWNSKQNALGYTAENSANKKTAWQAVPDNTSYPSEKLVKDNLDLKVDKVTGKQLSTEDYTTAEKTKLSGIAAGANNYTHPTGDGNSHVPATGTTNTGKVLKAGATANSASWGSVDWSEVVNKPTTFTATVHTHAISEVTNLQTSLDAKVKKIASSTDNAIMRFDGTTGDLPQNSLVTISDTGTINIPTGQNYNINGVNLKDVSETLTNKTLTSPVLNTEVTGTAVTTSGEASKLVKTVSAGNISMTQLVDGNVGVILNNTSTGGSANTGFQAKGNNLNYLSAWSYGSGRTSTIFGKTIGSYSALLAQGTDNAGLLFGTLAASNLVIGTNGVERYNINSSGVHTFTTPATTSYNAIFRNSSYSTTDSSGTSSIKIGYSNHDGVKIEAYKETANVSGVKFYGEYGFGTEKLLLNLKSSNGAVEIPSLAGTGNRMVVADSNGNLSASGVITKSITHQAFNYTAIYGINYVNSGTSGQNITLPLALLGVEVVIINKTQEVNTFLTMSGTNKIYDINGNDVTSSYTTASGLSKIKKIRLIGTQQKDRAGVLLNSGAVDWVIIELDGIGLVVTSHSHNFDDLISKPTTLSGYGITDANSEKWSTITISGDADKYYPVVFYISGIRSRTIAIKKDVHNYATWDGALTLEIEVQSAGYGGYAGYTNVKRLLHVGANPVKYFVASVSQSANANNWLIIWLLGGGRTYSYKKNLETDQNPIVYYSLTTLADTNGTVDVKTTVDSAFYQTNIIPADNYNYVKSSDVVTTATANKILKLDANAKLPANITGNADGNAATATKLQTARTINGVNFDGSANITINAVDSTARIASSEKGTANGVATLDSNGKVPSSQLPSYVDDVLEYTNYAGFPATGETGKIYVDLTTNRCYRWSGSAYVYITSGAVDSVNGKTGVVVLTKADVGLGNVPNLDTSNPANIVWAASYRTVTDTEKTTWNGKASTAVATTSANGLMSSTDKTKLDGIAAGANNYVHPTGDGNSHIPATGTTNNGKVLKAGATANSANWGSVDWSEVINKPTSMPASDVSSWAKASTKPTYTASEIGASDLSHAHAFSEITSKPTTLSSYGITDAVNSSNVTVINTAGKIVQRDGSGDVICRLVRAEYADQATISGGLVFRTAGGSGTDNYLRVCNNVSAIRTFLGTPSTAVATTSVNGLMSSTDKTKLDGLSNYTHPTSGVTAGTYRSVTVNTQGHITSGSNPTTLAGYGITDAVNSSDSRLTNARPASDVYDWAKASTKPSYIYSEVGAVPQRTRTNWNSDNASLGSVVGQLAWKGRGNGYTIFDASAETSPDGTTVGLYDAARSWEPRNPTLMGWDGTSTCGVRVDSAKNADFLSGYSVNVGRNDIANKIVITDSNGFIQAGLINTTSGDSGTTAISRIYASSDEYIRYYTPANFISVLNLVKGDDARLSDARAPLSHVHSVATQSTDGFMSATDKATLDSISLKANNTTSYASVNIAANTSASIASLKRQSCKIQVVAYGQSPTTVNTTGINVQSSYVNMDNGVEGCIYDFNISEVSKESYKWALSRGVNSRDYMGSFNVALIDNGTTLNLRVTPSSAVQVRAVATYY